MAKAICLDFDGVIHRYSKGWQKGVIYDPPVEGVQDFVDALHDLGYVVYVYSTRCSKKIGLNEVKEYCSKWGIDIDKCCHVKPPAVVYIDDRGLEFRGNFDYMLKRIKTFKPWYEGRLRVCKNCGQEFFAEVDRFNSAFCDDECRYKFRNNKDTVKREKRKKNAKDT